MFLELHAVFLGNTGRRLIKTYPIDVKVLRGLGALGFPDDLIRSKFNYTSTTCCVTVRDETGITDVRYGTSLCLELYKAIGVSKRGIHWR